MCFYRLRANDIISIGFFLQVFYNRHINLMELNFKVLLRPFIALLEESCMGRKLLGICFFLRDSK